MYTQVPFSPDIPRAIVVPAFPWNLIGANDGSFPANRPKVNVYHTPEEPADDVEVTPFYFARDLRPRRASTHYYADSDGDLYQMVPEKYGAIANGVTAGKPYPAGTDPNISLNLQSRSIEIEGYAATIHLTCRRWGRQWWTVVEWAVEGYYTDGIPLDRAHNIGHYEVASDRSDPGQLNINEVVEDAKMLVDTIEQLKRDVVRLTGENKFQQAAIGKFKEDIERLTGENKYQQAWLNEHSKNAGLHKPGS